MLDPIVQFIRNGLCCIKDLNLFNDTFLYDPSVVSKYYKGLPEPLDQTTPLEVLISVCQFFAFVSVTAAGLRLINDMGLKKWSRINKVLRLRSSPSYKSTDTAEKIIDESLAKEKSAAIRSLFIGLNVAPIGIAFFWLFANSWHVTATDWIGGLQGLIHALTVMEVCLLVLLYYMIIDGNEHFAKSKRMIEFAKTIREKQKSGNFSSTLNAETFGWVSEGGSWSPFWSGSCSEDTAHWIPYMPTKNASDSAEEKSFNEEVTRVKVALKYLGSADSTGSDKSDDKRVNALKQNLQETAARLESEAWTARMEGWREYFYFVVNFVAFYGYLLGILCYYFREDDEQIHYYLHPVKFYLSHDDADWYGNFWGDFMWTVEPIVILFSPPLLSWLKPKTKKVKSD